MNGTETRQVVVLSYTYTACMWNHEVIGDKDSSVLNRYGVGYGDGEKPIAIEEIQNVYDPVWNNGHPAGCYPSLHSRAAVPTPNDRLFISVCLPVMYFRSRQATTRPSQCSLSTWCPKPSRKAWMPT